MSDDHHIERTRREASHGSYPQATIEGVIEAGLITQPKKPRSEKQIAATERMRAALAAKDDKAEEDSA